jgi:hypothetical protein
MYPPPPGVTDVIGLECSGEIIEKGAEATMDWKVGDKAMTLLGGGGYGVRFSLSTPSLLSTFSYATFFLPLYISRWW